MTKWIGMTTMTATKSNRSRTRVRIRAYTRIRTGTCENAYNRIKGTRAPDSTRLKGTRASTCTKLKGTRAHDSTRLKGTRASTDIIPKAQVRPLKKARSVFISAKNTTISVSSSSRTFALLQVHRKTKKNKSNTERVSFFLFVLFSSIPNFSLFLNN